MKKETVTREELRRIAPGTTKIYTLPSPQKCVSVRVSCSYLHKYEGLEFSTSIDAETSTISVTRKIPSSFNS